MAMKNLERHIQKQEKGTYLTIYCQEEK